MQVGLIEAIATRQAARTAVLQEDDTPSPQILIWRIQGRTTYGVPLFVFQMLRTSSTFRTHVPSLPLPKSRSPMEAPEPQRRRWFSRFRRSIWAPSQPGTVDARDEPKQPRGEFFPFLGSNAVAASRPLGSNSRNRSTHGCGDSAGSETRGASARGVTEADKKRLKREVPSIWKYLQEQEGWSFVNNRNWDVCGPAASTSAAGGDGSGSGGTAQQQAGPMPQGQVRGVLGL